MIVILGFTFLKSCKKQTAKNIRQELNVALFALDIYCLALLQKKFADPWYKTAVQLEFRNTSTDKIFLYNPSLTSASCTS